MTGHYLDQPPAGWFVLDVMKREWRRLDWVALMIDVPPNDHRDGARPVRQCFVQIPGKHISRDAAYQAFLDMTATRH
jgi:hypothetical protein